MLPCRRPPRRQASPMQRACTETIALPARKRSRSMKWQASPTMRPPPTVRSCVQCSAGIAPAFTVITKPWARSPGEQQLHLLHLRREAAVEADHQLRSARAPALWCAASQAWRTASSSSSRIASGFSTNTCLPAASASHTSAAWLSWRVAMTTASTLGSASTASRRWSPREAELAARRDAADAAGWRPRLQPRAGRLEGRNQHARRRSCPRR